ncbi:Histidine kinase-, DNA gyrase B-, and HSP90-like ATPase [Desulfocicer vacuolatum DSM 3385]|uniref:Oxygen sensor histidine kinase NreB n=1 Tax=Desulfocicer vacuolatum DSM 3385 TaxID=1121400 RepID=A0A1W2BY72_9BACT|nr:ATP-binding protein [Desulfocicer vacuolatum]SMC77879.1 Histidine kinase-, DNA gyrase B-, and HSP90-like ATPase [Desulfocicer vacuolatum DSM 3385]
MKIHHKLLGVTLPIALVALLMGSYATFHLSRQALHQIAQRWLETRLDEAISVIHRQETFLRMYGITNIHAGTHKAQYDARQEVSAIQIGERGYVYILDLKGKLLFHPNAELIGSSMEQTPWFSLIQQQKKGKLNYTWQGEKHLAMFDFFEPWGWFIVATDPYNEIYGSLNKTRDYLLSMALWGSILISLFIIVMTRNIFNPLQLLVKGAEMVKKGELDIEIPVKSNDEMGNLTRIFNAMAQELKKNLETLQSSEQQLHYLNSQLLTAQEDERKRISTELHDEVGQSLTVMKLKMIMMEEGLAPENHAIKKEYEEMVQYIDMTIENVRRLCRDLTPTVITDLGLAAALMWLIENMEHHFDISADIDLSNVDEILSLERQLLVYRIFQESLSNAMKHARATRLELAATQSRHQLIFSIKDNGKGFDMGRVRCRNFEERGLGLATMQERARMLGGNMEIETRPGYGTRLQFTVPVDKGSKHGNL